MDYRIINYESHGDKDGQLVALEDYKDFPFDVKRVFYIYDTLEGVVRGKHAHKSLEEVLICVNGSCKVKMEDGEGTETVTLDSPTKGLYIGPSLWREIFDFTPGTVLLVLASDNYILDDYIRDYDEFIK